MSEEFIDEIDHSSMEHGEPEPGPIRLAKAEQRIREIEAANRSLRARCAELEGERDAAKKRSDFFEKEAMDWGHKNALIGSKLERAEADLELARAGEARAVEALRSLRLPLAQLGDFMYDAVRECSQDLLRMVNEALGDIEQNPDLDWLAQREREAAAEVWEEVGAGFGHWLGLDGKCDKNECFRCKCDDRAASLRAGKGEESHG